MTRTSTPKSKPSARISRHQWCPSPRSKPGPRRMATQHRGDQRTQRRRWHPAAAPGKCVDHRAPTRQGQTDRGGSGRRPGRRRGPAAGRERASTGGRQPVARRPGRRHTRPRRRGARYLSHTDDTASGACADTPHRHSAAGHAERIDRLAIRRHRQARTRHRGVGRAPAGTRRRVDDRCRRRHVHVRSIGWEWAHSQRFSTRPRPIPRSSGADSSPPRLRRQTRPWCSTVPAGPACAACRCASGPCSPTPNRSCPPSFRTAAAGPSTWLISGVA